MTAIQPMSRFDCPHCGARYTLVRVEVETAEADSQIACRSCGGPLNGHEGRFILKYFLVDRRRGDRARVDSPVDSPKVDSPRVDRPRLDRPTRADRPLVADRPRREAQSQHRS